jgi:hypothetical protein
MKTATFIFLTISLFIQPVISRSQDSLGKMVIDTEIEKGKLKKTIVDNKLALYSEIVKLIKSNSRDSSLMGYTHVDSLRQKAIIIVKHQFKYINDSTFTENTKNDEIIVLHKDKSDKDTKKWSDYLLNTKDILLVFVGGETNLQNSKVKIVKKKSFFTTSMADMIALIKALNPVADAAKLPVSFVLLNPKKLASPCTIKISHEEQKDSLEVEIHEKNFFAFHAGVSGQQLNKNQIKLQNQQLIVALDSTQKKDWASNLAVFLTFYPFGGRDIDRFDPIHKINLRGKKTQHILYKLTLERIGVFGGVKMSKDPIQNIYFGGSYAFSKALNFNIGWVWANTLTPSVTNVGSINSFADAVKYADRKYERQLFIGVSFAPSSVTEILGLNKDKDK